MANTRHDPELDLGGTIAWRDYSESGVTTSTPKPPRVPLTGRAGLQAGDRREQNERYESQLGTGADLAATPVEERQNSARQLRAIREQLQNSIASDVGETAVPQVVEQLPIVHDQLPFDEI